MIDSLMGVQESFQAVKGGWEFPGAAAPDEDNTGDETGSMEWGPPRGAVRGQRP
jgi:hypothetical protein